MNKLFINKIVSNGLFINIKKKSILFVDKFKQLVDSSVTFTYKSGLKVLEFPVILLRGKVQNNTKTQIHTETHKLYRNEVKNNHIVHIENTSRSLFKSITINDITSKVNTFAHKLFRGKTIFNSTTGMKSDEKVLLRVEFISSASEKINTLCRKLLRGSCKEKNITEVKNNSTLLISSKALFNNVNAFNSYILNRVFKYDAFNLNDLDGLYVKNMDSIYPTLSQRCEVVNETKMVNVAYGELIVKNK